MADNAFRCRIITPSESAFDGEATYASVPAWDGQMGLLAGSAPRLAKLGIGGLRLDLPEGGSRWFLIEGGFLQVSGGLVTLLTERAVEAEQLSEEEASNLLEEANARAVAGGEDREMVEADQQRARTMATLAGRS